MVKILDEGADMIYENLELMQVYILSYPPCY